MKKLLFLILIIGLGVYFYRENPYLQEVVARKKMIAEHRVGLNMTLDEVRRSLGEPSSLSEDPATRRETWIYPDNRKIEFSEGRVISITDANAQVAPGATKPTSSALNHPAKR